MHLSEDNNPHFVGIKIHLRVVLILKGKRDFPSPVKSNRERKPDDLAPSKVGTWHQHAIVEDDEAHSGANCNLLLSTYCSHLAHSPSRVQNNTQPITYSIPFTSQYLKLRGIYHIEYTAQY